MLNTMVHTYTRILAIDPALPVIMTGGDARRIRRQLSFPCRYSPLLIMHGLKYLAKKSQKNLDKP